MAKPLARGMLLAAVAFAVKAALAQTPSETEAVEEVADEVDVATPGGLVVLDEVRVESRRNTDIQQAVPEVVSVLSAEDIARTGEGDIAGALSFVPGLSVVGSGFVYVRGLGDRYSLALLNGSPLPSPEPLRRAVPLDLFPTDVMASSLVQKTYSPNYPGEFGGGVINLTTLAIPKMPFLSFGASTGADGETTGQLGYTHYGSSTDWTGYDNGNRDIPPGLADFIASGQRISAEGVDSGDIAKQFVNWHNGLVQKDGGMPANWSTSLSAGTSWMVGDGGELGIIGTAGYSNKWRTRDILQQLSQTADLSEIDRDYRSISSENRLVTNALVGLGYQREGNTLRWTNLYIHDTLKRTSLAEGVRRVQHPDADFRQQGTGWYERELFSTQLSGSVAITDTLGADMRASWSQSARNAPFEFETGYERSNAAADPFGAYFINRLGSGGVGFANISFSDLDEDLWSAGGSLSWRARDGLVLSAGYDYSYTARESSRRAFTYRVDNLPSEVGLLRPDLLLGAAIIDNWDVYLTEDDEDLAAFAGRLLTHGAYAQVQARLAAGLELSAGARFERAKQVTRPVRVFATGTTLIDPTRLEEDYVLPSATLTWKLANEQQLRFSASKTIARPQFRELLYQQYFDPESNRVYRGNPLLGDSEFLNGEVRYEWYFAPEQRFAIAGFYKQIDRPIESYIAGDLDNNPQTRFANAPEATLYGAEVEAQKYVALDSLGETGWGFLARRRLVIIGNYTYTDSEIKVGPDDTVDIYVVGGAATNRPADQFFVDGSRLSGQSNHLMNLQLGLERPDRLSQQTIMLSYGSDRVTSRGFFGLPDIYESPGLKVDLVARQGFALFGQELEGKLEVRNIFGRGYKEFQRSGDNVVYYNKYDLGRSVSVSFSMNF